MFQARFIESSPASRVSVPATDLIYVVIPVAFLVANFAHQELGFICVICVKVLIVEVLDGQLLLASRACPGRFIALPAYTCTCGEHASRGACLETL